MVTPLEKVLKMCFYFDTCFFMTSSGIYAVVILKDGESDSGESDSGEETARSLKQLVKRRLAPLLSLS